LNKTNGQTQQKKVNDDNKKELMEYCTLLSCNVSLKKNRIETERDCDGGSISVSCLHHFTSIPSMDRASPENLALGKWPTRGPHDLARHEHSLTQKVMGSGWPEA
jgi:hypothetical protein